ncbi:18010_t:CDS:2, partial [Gigaspora rosea]
MPAKLSAICFVHSHVDRLTQEFTVREVTGIVKLSDDDPNKIIYLNIKVFIPVNETVNYQIESFDTGDVIATSIKVIDFDFETMPPLDDLALDFYVEERIGEKEPSSFWVKARHKASSRYLFNKTNIINQISRSTTALLIGRSNRTPRGAIPRTPRSKCSTLSSMNPTSTSTLSSAVETNPIPNMSDQQSSNKTSQ